MEWKDGTRSGQEGRGYLLCIPEVSHLIVPSSLSLVVLNFCRSGKWESEKFYYLCRHLASYSKIWFLVPDFFLCFFFCKYNKLNAVMNCILETPSFSCIHLKVDKFSFSFFFFETQDKFLNLLIFLDYKMKLRMIVVT